MAGSRWMVAAGVGVLLVAAAIVGRTAGWEPGQVGGRPLPGVPLRSPVELRLLVANDVVVSRRDCRGSGCEADSRVYLVRHGRTVATPLAAASDVESSRDGQGVWLLARPDGTRCTLGQVGLDGRPRRPALPVPCESVLIDELPAGLLVYVSRSGGGAGPTARWSPPTAASAGSPRWSTAWPAGTWC